jgi:pimeloyl-ACP methyl ester carboxylesterase
LVAGTYLRLKAGELSFNVLEAGSGKPALLFLHNCGGSARTRNAVTLRLSTDFRSIAYDQRGWGQSDAPAQGYSIQDWLLTLNTSSSRYTSVDMF